MLKPKLKLGPKGPKNPRKNLPEPRGHKPTITQTIRKKQRRLTQYSGIEDAENYLERQILKQDLGKVKLVTEAKGPLKITDIHTEIKQTIRKIPKLIREGMPILTAQKIVLDEIADKISALHSEASRKAYIRAVQSELEMLTKSSEYKKAVEERKKIFLEERKQKLAKKRDHKYEISMHG